MKTNFTNNEIPLSLDSGLRPSEKENYLTSSPWFRNASTADLYNLNAYQHQSRRCEWLHHTWQWIKQNETIRCLFTSTLKMAKYAVAVPCLVVTACGLIYSTSLATGVLICELAFSKPYLVKAENEEPTLMGQFVFTPIVGCMIMTSSLGLIACGCIGIALGIMKRHEKNRSRHPLMTSFIEETKPAVLGGKNGN